MLNNCIRICLLTAAMTVAAAETARVQTAPQAQQSVTAPDEHARYDYQLTERLNTKEGWVLFINRYPDSFYADLARAQIAKLESAAKAPAPATPSPAAPQPTAKLPAPQPPPAQAAQPKAPAAAAVKSSEQIYCDSRGCRPVPANCKVARAQGSNAAAMTLGDQLVCN